ncbi:S1 RNA-binding domain-containing protein [Streptomyces coerulescens]|uniref:S1 RNA-binding domain-containing protein n=1 Tax=Streptomyces coerulescens TaxID=29304 RepID=A0ABW0CN00_STRCD
MTSHITPDHVHPGDILKGVVSGIVDFGAYVDLGGVEGLIDRLEVSWNRQEVSAILHVGQEVTVQVLDADVRHGAIRLSLRALFPDPILEFAREKLGAIVPARISYTGPIGVLAEVADGLTGLIQPRLQETSPGDPQRKLRLGDHVFVEVISVNSQERRIGLRLSASPSATP